MREKQNVITHLVARVRALFFGEWMGRAGEHFRQTADEIADFAEKHEIRPRDLLNDGIELGRRKVEGLANKEFAEATRHFAEAEQKKIEIELQRRSLESKVRKEEAEAKSAELKALDAEIELLKKLKEIGVILSRDESGRMVVLPLPTGCDLMQLAAAKRSREHGDWREVLSQQPEMTNNLCVMLISSGKDKIAVIKAIRDVTSKTLSEAKDMIHSAPTFVEKNINKLSAELICEALTEAGATVTLLASSE
jgi:ribosomal protein L7/L12